MSKVIKYFSVFFLWIAVLAICAHLIIPHDHHLVESVANQDESCPVSGSNTGHHSGFPVHCHAFNELVSGRATTFVLKKIIQSDDLSYSSFSDLFILELQVPLITILQIREPFPDSYLLELSSFRAPPSLF